MVVALDEDHYWAGLITSEFGQISVVQLVEPAAGDATRLLIRFRASFAPRLAAWAFWLAFDPGDFLFMRREMLGIKRRAEHSRR